jgi:hypothetical protein
MTPEHLVNTLNMIERDEYPPKNEDEEEYRADAYFNMRAEAVRRGLRWRAFSRLNTRDGELMRGPKGWYWQPKPVTTRFDCAGQDSWETIYVESRAPTLKGLIESLIGRRARVKIRSEGPSGSGGNRPGYSGEKGVVEEIELLPERPEEVTLHQIAIGEQFRVGADGGSVPGPYIRVDPRGELWTALKEKGYVQVDGAFVKGTQAPRYAVASLVTGATFLRPGYEKVVRIPRS